MSTGLHKAAHLGGAACFTGVMSSPFARTAVWGRAAPLLGALCLVACIPPGRPAASGLTELRSCGPDGLIDDGEDGNNQTKVAGSRGGYWYTFKDPASGSTVLPEAGEGSAFAMSEPGASGSRYAAHVTGHVGQGEAVFAGMGLNFVDPMAPYDASAYKGVAFWAKRGPHGHGRVRFKVPDVATHEKGGVCTDCFNDFGVEILVTEGWQHFAFPWRKLRQIPGWGSPRPHLVKSAKAFGLQWQVSHPGADVDLWVDDVEFLCE